MSDLPFDLRQNENESDESTHEESPRSRFIVSTVIVVLLFLFLAAVIFALMKSLESGRRLARMESLPVDELAQYSSFAEKTEQDNQVILNRLSMLEKSLTVTDGRLDQSDESIGNLKAAVDQNRSHIDDLDKRLRTLSDTLAQQQKAASDLRRKIAQKQSSSMKAAAQSDVQLFSVRSFGNVSAVRLAAKSGEISPLLRIGDEWNGWHFIRLDGSKAIFSTNGREQVLVL